MKSMITRVFSFTMAEHHQAPPTFESRETTYVFSLDELYHRFSTGEYHPLSSYTDFRQLVWTLLMYQDSVEVWNLMDHMLDPPFTAEFYEVMELQLNSFMNTLLEQYVKNLPTLRYETVVPVFVTESSAYVKSVPYQ